jgi:hypothetical protein
MGAASKSKGKTPMNRRTTDSHSRNILALSLAAGLLLILPAAQAQVQLDQLSTDTFTNSSSQHATEVEPDTYSYGSTIVTAFQVGRIQDGGASDIGFATSTNGGASWTNGFLPGITTFYQGGKYTAASDASVVFDAAHSTWLITSIAITNAVGVAVLASSSSDGITWNNPIKVQNSPSGFTDKDWISCDNTPTSPYYGHCYVEWEDAYNGDQVEMNTSSDGGHTWSAPFNVPNAFGLGGQPIVQPNGTAVVPFLGNGIQVFTSTDGGKTWGSLAQIATVTDHAVNGNLRAVYTLPSADIDAAGKVYVAWWDCRFRTHCSSNDIVTSTSSDAKTWSPVTRIPIDPTTTTEDHFIPGIAVDHATSGSTAHIGVTYYFYPVASCTVSTCKLGVGFVSSTNAGKSWTKAKGLVNGMKTGWLPTTTLGQMVGDYISTSYVNGKAFGVFAKATANVGSTFNEGMFTPATGFFVEGEGPYLTSEGEQPVPNAKSDHPPVPYFDSEGRVPKPPSKETSPEPKH